MKDFFAPDVWPFIVAAIVWWLLTLAPLFFSSYVALRTKPTLLRRFLFVSVVAGLSYGFLVIFVLVVSLPLSAFGTYIAPQLESVGQLTTVGRWAVMVGDSISAVGWFIIPVALAISTFKLTRYLAPRWEQVVLGLRPRKGDGGKGTEVIKPG